MKDRETKYVTCPDLSFDRVKGSAGEIQVKNRAFRTGVEAPLHLLDVLEFLREPRSMDELSARFAIDEEVVEMLLAKYIILPAGERELLGPGIVSAARDSVGVSCSFGDLARLGSPKSFVVFGVPVDLLGSPGAHAGPAQTRSYSMLRGIERVAEGDGETRALPRDMEILDLDRRRSCSFGAGDGHAILDAGDVAYVRGESIGNVGQRIERLVSVIAARKMTPVMLGGDHSITWHALKVLLGTHPRLGILHFDAHHDMYPSPTALLPLRNNNPFAHACQSPSLSCLRQFGLRTVEYYPSRTNIKVRDPRVSYWSALELQRMSPDEALAGLDPGIPYYLSFDIDCIRPEEAPETGTPVCGGLSFYQAFELVNAIVERFELAGADFVEVAAPRPGSLNMAATITARLLDVVLLSRIPSRRLDSYAFHRREWKPDERP